MSLAKLIYSSAKTAIKLQHKVSQYVYSVFPSSIEYILRIDVSLGCVIDEYCIRHKRVKETSFYYMRVWNRTTKKYHVYFLSGRIIKRDMRNLWEAASPSDLVDLLYDLYDKPHQCKANEGILAILVANVDVTSSYANIRNSLMILENVTAEALVLLHKYFVNACFLPYYANLHELAIELIKDAMNIDDDDNCTWEGRDSKVTIVDYELEEREYIGNVYLAT